MLARSLARTPARTHAYSVQNLVTLICIVLNYFSKHRNHVMSFTLNFF